ncbi:MAG: hypothetical protein PSX81_13955 [bacterium]|nr:hypothetical protein [bacterium]
MNKIILSVFSIVALVACNSGSNTQELSAQVENLQKWIDSVKTANVVYDSTTLETLDGQYKMASADLAANTDKLKEEEKAKLEASQKSWDEYKVVYVEKMNASKAAEAPAMTGFNDEAKIVMAKTIFGNVAMMNTMDFSWVNASNILSTYNGFYDKFNTNKSSYDADQLAYVKALYEALDTRKNEVEKEKEFKGTDNIKIAQTKTKFAALFATEKTGSKSE